MKRKWFFYIACFWFGVAIGICGISVLEWKFWLIMFSGHALAWFKPESALKH